MCNHKIIEHENNLSKKRIIIVFAIWAIITSIPIFFTAKCSYNIFSISLICWLTLLNLGVLVSYWLVDKFWKK